METQTRQKIAETNKKIYNIDNFNELAISENILQGIMGCGYETPRPVQKYSMKPISMGYDVVVEQKSGSGKTVAFVVGSLSILENCDEYKKGHIGPKILVICPTRELADQIYKEYVDITTYTKFTTALVIGGCFDSTYKNNNGGKNYEEDILVCTPGKLMTLMEKKRINTSMLKTCIMDEVDELLKRNFLETLKQILLGIPQDTQMSLFSATISTDIENLIKQFTKDPILFLLEKEQVNLDIIKQYYINTDTEDNKLKFLMDIYNTLNINQSIIFCNYIETIEWLYAILIKNNYSIKMFHGKMSQPDRDSLMNDFKTGKVKHLLSSDVLARGIDVQQLSLVINYDIPHEKETYYHRIGRTGRDGKHGIVINLVTKTTLKDLMTLVSAQKTVINPLLTIKQLN